MKAKRKQLTLFLPEDQIGTLEKIREQFNPVQYKLIKSHITLCREDEIKPLEKVLDNLAKLTRPQLTVHLGSLRRFSEGKGVMIPGAADNSDFHLLRKKVLEEIIDNPRNHQPHITLMHPRNSSCTDEIFQQIVAHNFPTQISFYKISLIEQKIGAKWQVLKEFEFANG